MNISNERKLASYIKKLGENASADAFQELSDFCHSKSPLLRRLAASAIGKLAGIVDSTASVDLLRSLLSDTHPQVRQYSSKALSAFGVAAACVLEDLRDIYQNPDEKNYVKRSVVASGKLINESLKIAEQKKIYKCYRCSVIVNSDEYARSMKAFNRIYCDKCFDEVYLKRRNFDTNVELNKKIRTNDGNFVQSLGEQKIADWLTNHNILYRYDQRYRIISDFAVRPDFYLPEFDIYIEYWGMDTPDYKIGMLKKLKLYQQEGKKLLSLYPKDKNNLDSIMKQKLSKYIRIN
ncbi:HEAT repeat domain-containing protein [bacterium]|nr:HEAT repeat domain-containing protein [bacterium]